MRICAACGLERALIKHDCWLYVTSKGRGTLVPLRISDPDWHDKHRKSEDMFRELVVTTRTLIKPGKDCRYALAVGPARAERPGRKQNSQQGLGFRIEGLPHEP